MSASLLPAKARVADLLRGATFRVVAALMFCALVILFFPSVPAPLRWPVRIAWLFAVAWVLIKLLRTVCTARLTWRKSLFILVIVLVQYLCVALACQVFIVVMSKRDDRLTTRGLSKLTPECVEGIQAMLSPKGFNIFSRELGWELRPGRRSRLYAVNQQGLRSLREHDLTPADPDRRFLCMGDSFTFGTAVGDDETYPAHCEKLMPGSEWLNFGVPGTCLTQSYLHYRRNAAKFGGRHVIIGFMSNDAMRTVNCFRPFVNTESNAPLTKPFVRLREGKFSLEPNPYSSADDYRRLLADDRAELDKLRRLDYLSWVREKQSSNPILRTLSYIVDARQLDRSFDMLLDSSLPFARTMREWLPQDPYGRAIYRPTSEGFVAITALFDLYHQQVVSDGRVPLIVILPGPLDVEDFESGAERQYAPLLAHLRARNYAVLDFLDPLVASHRADLKTSSLFAQSHYKAHINQELAAAVIGALPPR